MPSPCGRRVKSDPDIHRPTTEVCTRLEIARSRVLSTSKDGFGPLRFHLGPEVLAPTGLCCPRYHCLATSSASLVLSVSLPSAAGYRAGLWHSRILLPEHQTFRAFLTRLSRIAAFSFRRETRWVHCPVLPHRLWPSSRAKSLLASPIVPLISFLWDPISTTRPFAFATALLFARPRC